ncbi:histidinol dehydrogenase [Nesterenkonia sp. E16_7]|uniref:histidinol dehydrogenase n=1 Tax=unclassified Nesterenkonia TaxID=2629769 RepID=UPI001A9146BC|nr:MULTISPECIES: histidinol dehydrogenase [unclassified Nesterenkonia]MBO0594625.1 histidinol dehydrogenase [Nesterenkonia sp. E16_10]MBO0598078.1 histidinol dehydrogenase [Nesterenkonia sp. E16_7]
MLTLKDLRGSTIDAASVLPRASQDISTTIETVAPILQNVRLHGVSALLDYSEKFDGVRPPSLRVPAEKLREAAEQLEPEVRAALEELILRARAVHEAQLPEASEVSPGLGARVINRWAPIRRVGLYVPGGQAVYPSSVVMNVVPAQVAGVRSLAIASPPQADFGGLPHPTILGAAHLLGIEEVYAVGGAQAVAMFAYGAKDQAGQQVCPPVSLITGPGNIFVATAKRAVQGVVGIDSEAGPTEIMVLADDSAPAELIAADLISQAEHDALAAAVLVTPSMALAEAVATQVERQARETRHADRVKQALSGTQSALLVVDTMEQGVEIANAYGAEHLELMTRDDAGIVDQIHNAGAVFVGAHTPVSLGDYCAGSNHVLPTGGASAYSSGLNVSSFLRSQQVIHYDREGLRAVAAHVSALAQAEGLPAHGDAVQARFR